MTSGHSVNVAVVVGGTTTSVALSDSPGRLLRNTKLPTAATDGFESAMVRMEEAVLSLLQLEGLQPADIEAIGIGCTGPVDSSTGMVLTDFMLPGWKGRSITRSLSERFGKPAVMANNADVAVLGEAISRKALTGILVLLTLGTGVGGGAVIDGQIYQGARREHPEIGHILVREDGPECYCGSVGCLEMAASGTAIGASGRKVGFASSRAVFERARAGDIAAMQIVDRAVDCTVRGVWALLHTFLPDCLVLGGGVMEAHYDLFMPSIQAAVDRATMVPAGGVSLESALPGNESGLIGAAYLAHQHIPVRK